ncbi:MAG: MFS transporter [Clostridiales bacterium]|nr:MFS transporter [Clostridiales bacterium]
MKLSQNAKNALYIGSLCSVAYLAVYVVRNILSAVSPQMIADGSYSTEEIGTISSIYFICYAIGQLCNGVIGDKIKAKYMISTGLLLAGIANALFPMLTATPVLAKIAYGSAGIFLAMIYGPLTKVVAENTDPIYTTRCCLGYTFASFFGSPLAGIMATIFVWQETFFVGSASLIFMSIVCFGGFILYEKKGIVKYGVYQNKEKVQGNIKILFKRQIVKFSLIAIITGIVRTAVVFWLPTYSSQYLGFTPQDSARIFTVMTFIISLNPFIVVFLFERLKRNIDLTILLSFSASCTFFLAVFFIKIPYVNLACLLLAVMGSNGASSMLWSRYCPSLRDTGMVSSVTGFLDFLSYMAAAFSSSVFANAVGVIGWGNLILVWFGLVLCGFLTALPWKKLFSLRVQEQNQAKNAE